jgi:hypothetical protein
MQNTTKQGVSEMALKPNPLDPQSVLGVQASPPVDLFPGNGLIAGETVAQWTQDWWTWVLQSPFDASAMFDPTGAFANTNNTGAMFFIGGSFGGDATRTFDVPASKPLLVPILNNIAAQFTGHGPDPATGGKGAANIAQAEFQTSVTDLSLNIDGKAIGNLQSDLVRTDWFSPGNTAAPGSVANVFASLGVFVPGDLGPAKSVGYWAVIQGLTAGSTHTLDFGGSTSSGFSLHIHDTIHVV